MLQVKNVPILQYITYIEKVIELFGALVRSVFNLQKYLFHSGEEQTSII